MRLIRKAIVLGLAGLGLYKAWELLSPMVGSAKEKSAQARDRVEPALRDATEQVRSASRDAVGSVVGASKDAVGTVGDAVEDVVTDVDPQNDDPQPPAGASSSASAFR